MTQDEYWELVARTAAKARADTHTTRRALASLDFDEILDVLRWTTGWTDVTYGPGVHDALRMGNTEAVLREVAVYATVGDISDWPDRQASFLGQQSSRLTASEYERDGVDPLVAVLRRRFPDDSASGEDWLVAHIEDHPLVYDNVGRALDVLRLTEHPDAAHQLRHEPEAAKFWELMELSAQRKRGVPHDAHGGLQPAAEAAREIVETAAAAALYADVVSEARRSERRYSPNGDDALEPNPRIPKHAFENLVHNLASRYRLRTVDAEDIIRDPLIARAVTDIDSALDALTWSRRTDLYAPYEGARSLRGFDVRAIIENGARTMIAMSTLRLLEGKAFVRSTTPRPMTYEEYWHGVATFAAYVRRVPDEPSRLEYVLREGDVHPFVHENWDRSLDVLRHTDHLEFITTLPQSGAWYFLDALPVGSNEAARERLAEFEEAVDTDERNVAEYDIELAAKAAFMGDVLHAVGLRLGALHPNQASPGSPWSR